MVVYQLKQRMGFRWIKSLKMKNRLGSFKNWPIPYIDVRELAKDGFYYTGYSDIVECRFCRLRLYRFEADDDVKEEHHLHAPYCPFLRTPYETDNIELKIKDYEKLVKEKVESIRKNLK